MLQIDTHTVRVNAKLVVKQKETAVIYLHYTLCQGITM